MEIESDSAALPASQPVEDALKNAVKLIEKSVKLKDTRLLMGRLMRQTAAIRKGLNADNIRYLLKYISSSPSAAYLQSQIQDDFTAMDEDAIAADAPAQLLPEVEMYTYLLVLLYLTDKKQFAKAKEVSTSALQRLATFNRRTLDAIAARIYFYYSWSHECTDTLQDIRGDLLALHRTAVLRYDSIGQETLLNLLLRNYLHYNLYDQAEKLRSKAQKEEHFRSNQEYCRYLYYMGRIRAIQLEYTDAREFLQQAHRKAPTSALGFRTTTLKWLVLVKLLLGDIPDRTEFSADGLKTAMQPYLELTTAVRHGDVQAFHTVTKEHGAVFRADKTANLITRLHHNVIRIGLRRINLAYSRISLQDVAQKLRLSSPEEAEHIVAKAIRDGGIDAVLHHKDGYMQSRDMLDVYSTTEPQAAFHARIAFCLDIHNEAVKAMRFEPDAHKKKLESSEARKERLAQEQELAQSMQEDDF